MTWKRYVPPDLLAHIQTRQTTLCEILKIMPVDGPAFGICSLDQEVHYDDGTADGLVFYSSHYGFDGSAIAYSADSGVDNAEADFLFGIADTLVHGITLDMVNDGYLDNATYVRYLVNYEDLREGVHAELMSGPLGEARIRQGRAGKVELRTRSQLLAQVSVCQVGSKSCRATFGDATTGCYYDVAPEWVDFTVTSVQEADRQFTDSSLAQAAGYFYPGLVEWVTGDNAGKTFETEDFDTGGIITLAHPTYYAVQVGDTGRIRRDCAKTREACIAFGQIKNMRAEPDTPEGDSRGNQAARALR
jgi:uncharacterized phage protein (TIGR02218 family)